MASPGVIGCASSHLRIWAECEKEGVPYLVLEDDVVFEDRFCDNLSKVYAELGELAREVEEIEEEGGKEDQVEKQLLRLVRHWVCFLALLCPKFEYSFRGFCVLPRMVKQGGTLQARHYCILARSRRLDQPFSNCFLFELFPVRRSMSSWATRSNFGSWNRHKKHTSRSTRLQITFNKMATRLKAIQAREKLQDAADHDAHGQMIKAQAMHNDPSRNSYSAQAAKQRQDVAIAETREKAGARAKRLLREIVVGETLSPESRWRTFFVHCDALIARQKEDEVEAREAGHEQHHRFQAMAVGWGHYL